MADLARCQACPVWDGSFEADGEPACGGCYLLCSTCDGAGYDIRWADYTCPTCHGSGEFVAPHASWFARLRDRIFGRSQPRQSDSTKARADG